MIILNERDTIIWPLPTDLVAQYVHIIFLMVQQQVAMLLPNAEHSLWTMELQMNSVQMVAHNSLRLPSQSFYKPGVQLIVNPQLATLNPMEEQRQQSKPPSVSFREIQLPMDPSTSTKYPRQLCNIATTRNLVCLLVLPRYSSAEHYAISFQPTLNTMNSTKIGFLPPSTFQKMVQKWYSDRSTPK